jgi:hypothetical protein
MKTKAFEFADEERPYLLAVNFLSVLQSAPFEEIVNAMASDVYNS